MRGQLNHILSQHGGFRPLTAATLEGMDSDSDSDYTGEYYMAESEMMSDYEDDEEESDFSDETYSQDLSDFDISSTFDSEPEVNKKATIKEISEKLNDWGLKTWRNMEEFNKVVTFRSKVPQGTETKRFNTFSIEIPNLKINMHELYAFKSEELDFLVQQNIPSTHPQYVQRDNFSRATDLPSRGRKKRSRNKNGTTSRHTYHGGHDNDNHSRRGSFQSNFSFDSMGQPSRSRSRSKTKKRPVTANPRTPNYKRGNAKMISGRPMTALESRRSTFLEEHLGQKVRHGHPGEMVVPMPSIKANEFTTADMLYMKQQTQYLAGVGSDVLADNQAEDFMANMRKKSMAYQETPRQTRLNNRAVDGNARNWLYGAESVDSDLDYKYDAGGYLQSQELTEKSDQQDDTDEAHHAWFQKMSKVDGVMDGLQVPEFKVPKIVHSRARPKPHRPISSGGSVKSRSRARRGTQHGNRRRMASNMPKDGKNLRASNASSNRAQSTSPLHEESLTVPDGRTRHTPRMVSITEDLTAMEHTRVASGGGGTRMGGAKQINLVRDAIPESELARTAQSLFLTSNADATIPKYDTNERGEYSSDNKNYRITSRNATRNQEFLDRKAQLDMLNIERLMFEEDRKMYISSIKMKEDIKKDEERRRVEQAMADHKRKVAQSMKAKAAKMMQNKEADEKAKTFSNKLHRDMRQDLERKRKKRIEAKRRREEQRLKEKRLAEEQRKLQEIEEKNRQRALEMQEEEVRMAQMVHEAMLANKAKEEREAAKSDGHNHDDDGRSQTSEQSDTSEKSSMSKASRRDKDSKFAAAARKISSKEEEERKKRKEARAKRQALYDKYTPKRRKPKKKKEPKNDGPRVMTKEELIEKLKKEQEEAKQKTISRAQLMGNLKREREQLMDFLNLKKDLAKAEYQAKQDPNPENQRRVETMRKQLGELQEALKNGGGAQQEEETNDANAQEIEERKRKAEEAKAKREEYRKQQESGNTTETLNLTDIIRRRQGYQNALKALSNEEIVNLLIWCDRRAQRDAGIELPMEQTDADGYQHYGEHFGTATIDELVNVIQALDIQSSFVARTITKIQESTSRREQIAQIKKAHEAEKAKEDEERAAKEREANEAREKAKRKMEERKKALLEKERLRLEAEREENKRKAELEKKEKLEAEKKKLEDMRRAHREALEAKSGSSSTTQDSKVDKVQNIVQRSAEAAQTGSPHIDDTANVKTMQNVLTQIQSAANEKKKLHKDKNNTKKKLNLVMSQLQASQRSKVTDGGSRRSSASSSVMSVASESTSTLEVAKRHQARSNMKSVLTELKKEGNSSEDSSASEESGLVVRRSRRKKSDQQDASSPSSSRNEALEQKKLDLQERVKQRKLERERRKQSQT
eukprot:TRINITY_DN1941_c0_g1_i4.p1 TRINITY_DN1941_c0_g1~~TRINITY_DN1941_c0_g1_i4.p1  ORF type:complete len:1408 (-),score=560.34 TRINITY_DN1941_c0_g1_i4:2417-6553(-)